MKIYIATPVNARKEATLEEKRRMAYHRVCYIRQCLKKLHPDADFRSSFDNDIAPINVPEEYLLPEANIMGKCVQRVMECDAIVIDGKWWKSKGVTLERMTAILYKKQLIKFEDLNLRKE